MADFTVRTGAQSAQGLRANNEDCFVVDQKNNLYLVADGMGGQDAGEKASGLAAEIIPRVVSEGLAAREDASQAVARALDEANKAIINASQSQVVGRRMGTTAVLALQAENQVFVAGLGDSRAYLVRGDRVEQLTHDHTVADALERNGTLTHEQAQDSPWKNVLYKFLGCAEMVDGAEVRPLTPQSGDVLVLASDGLTNHITPEDLRDGARAYADPQLWANALVELALKRGSRDNVTVVVVAFLPE